MISHCLGIHHILYYLNRFIIPFCQRLFGGYATGQKKPSSGVVTVEITEVRITLRNEEKLKAFASVTFDNCFVVRGLKIINGSQGYFVSMPSRKRKDGTYQDIAHPINNEMRTIIEDRVLDAFEQELSKHPATTAVTADAGKEREEVFELE
jgi:stage V sporulation protein G